MALADLMENKQVSDLLLDPKIYDTLEKIAQTHNIPSERSEEFLDLTEAVMDEVIPIKDMPTVLAEAFDLSEEAAKKLAADISGARLLAFSSIYPEIETLIKDWGGDILQYPKTRIVKERISANKLAARVLKTADITIPETSVKRFGFLLWELSTKKRTPEQFREFLARRTNAGGLGLASESVDKLFVAAVKERNFVEVVDEDSLTPHLAKPNLSATEKARQPVPQKKIDSQKSVTETRDPSPSLGISQKAAEEHPELAVAKQKVDKVVKKLAIEPEEALAKAIEIAVESGRSSLGEGSISEKLFRDIAEKAIRGIRDLYQTRDILEQGNKLAGKRLAALLEATKKGIETYEQAGGVTEEPLIANEQSAVVAIDEAKLLDKRFAKLAKRKPSESVEPIMSGARVSAFRTSEEEFSLQAKKLGLEVASLERPEPARTELTMGSVPIAQQKGQRKVIDVVATRRLMGPVEQLGAMSPADFRRLSSNAAEAANRIEDQISSLAATAYEERVKGIEAWRRSPMNQLYLTMAEEALAQGASLPEVSSRRRAAGQEALSPAEIKAIIALNAKIRF